MQTGYATVDKPWNRFYEDAKLNTLFLNTTPYIGLVENNRAYPQEIAIEYFGAKIRYGNLIRNIDNTAKALVAYGVKKA